MGSSQISLDAQSQEELPRALGPLVSKSTELFQKGLTTLLDYLAYTALAALPFQLLSSLS